MATPYRPIPQLEVHYSVVMSTYPSRQAAVAVWVNAQVAVLTVPLHLTASGNLGECRLQTITCEK